MGQTHVTHGSLILIPPESSTQMVSRSLEPFLQGSLLWQTDRQTDRHHATQLVTIGCSYVWSIAMRPNNYKITVKQKQFICIYKCSDIVKLFLVAKSKFWLRFKPEVRLHSIIIIVQWQPWNCSHFNVVFCPKQTDKMSAWTAQVDSDGVQTLTFSLTREPQQPYL